MRKWLSKSCERHGWLETARDLKDLCGELRAAALEQRKPRLASCHHFPKSLLKWLDSRLSVKGKLAFSRLSRALPCAPESVMREAMNQHVNTLRSRHVTPGFLLQDIKHHISTLLRGAFQENVPRSLPSSSAATVEKGRSEGGYNSVVADLARPAWAEVVSGRARGGGPRGGGKMLEPSPLAAALERRLSKQLSGDKYHSYPTVVSAERNCLYATSKLLRDSVGKRVVHKASVIAELGMKARIITLPPAHVFARGDLVRQIVWPALLSRIPQILPYAPHTEEGILRRLSAAAHDSKVWLSADLTCATDGFGHDAIGAVIDGLRSAGLPAYLVSELRESLGVGDQPHYVRYRLSDLSGATRAWAMKTLPVIDGVVEVPKQRGSLMGTPCSFTVLSLLNHWMSERLGPRRIICGDDLAANTHPDNVSSYAQRASAVGSKLHETKSFRSKIGFVFCEAYALLSKEGTGVVSFRPPSLKEFVREGNGVMSQHSVDPSSFNRLARCARTIYAKQRKLATKKQRYPELPAILGGLGHPCKGRLRVPRSCRESLKELYLCESVEHSGPHNPGEYIRPLQTPAIPLSRRDLRTRRSQIDAFVENKKVIDYQPGDGFLTNRQLDTYKSVLTNYAYLATGGRFRKVRPHEKIVGKQRLPKPRDGCRGGVLSTQTRINQILEWDRRARGELGTYFPPAVSAHIRRKICAYQGGDTLGDDRS